MTLVVTDAPDADRDVLLARIGWLERENQALRFERDRLAAENAGLHARLEEARRAGKRQAAPFSKNKPAADPKRPGRKPGPGYGKRAWRRPPGRVDRIVGVPAPDRCPGCGGPVTVEGIVCQYQEDLPPARPERTRFDLEAGRCQQCGRRVRDRHPAQVSDALGAAGCVLGPNTIALGVWLRVGLGLSAVKACQVLARLGVEVTPGGLQQAIARAGDRAAPTYAALVQAVRDSPVVAPDETGWRVGGRRAWLWAFVGAKVVVYRIAKGRGSAEAAAVLGEGFGGVLERDGWVAYRAFTEATHQTCLGHLLRRCGELVDDAGDTPEARLPRMVGELLGGLLGLRDRRDAGELDEPELGVEVAVAGICLDRLLEQGATHAPNRRLLGHLARERHALLTFLLQEGVEATNWRAEQAIRPAVVTRKTWGGNRTRPGADAWQALASVLATAQLQQRDPVRLVAGLLLTPGPTVADLALPARGP